MTTTDKIKLATEMLRECDIWAVDALTAYIHKSDFSNMTLTPENVLTHRDKIRNVIKQLEERKD